MQASTSISRWRGVPLRRRKQPERAARDGASALANPAGSPRPYRARAWPTGDWRTLAPVRTQWRMRMERSKMRRWLFTSVIAALSVAVLTGTAVSPYLLDQMWGLDGDLERLSLAGQAYGAAAAAFAGLAFLGVIAALATQQRQTRISQVTALRMQHTEVLKLTIEHPELYRAIRDDRNDDDLPTFAYINVMVNNVYLFWLMEEVDEHSACGELADMFTMAPFRRWWSEYGRPARAGSSTRSMKRFVALVDRASARAEQTVSERRPVYHSSPIANDTMALTRRDEDHSTGTEVPASPLPWIALVFAGVAVGAASTHILRSKSR